MPSPFGFTGQRSEPVLGLYFNKARFYDPSLSRFLQADSLIPGAGNPLAWDRYAYTLNAPTRYTDPSGHFCVDAGSGQICSADPDSNGHWLPNPQPRVRDFSYTAAEYSAAKEAYGIYLDLGISFYQQMYKHTGWWSPYMRNGRDSSFKFLIRLAYAIEGYSAYKGELWEYNFWEYLTDATINKCGDFYNQHGFLGILAFLGGREGLTRRLYSDDAPQWQKGSTEYMQAWDRDYLEYMGILWDDSASFINQAWNLITNYNGADIFGTGAWDYGQSPPMIVDPNKVIFRLKDQVVVKR